MSATLIRQIQQFYDASSGLWEQVWGEHMHHGYYGSDGNEKKDRRQAQIDLIEELLKWAGVQQAQNILDVGCGIGGSSLYLAHKFNATATGITLSPVDVVVADSAYGTYVDLALVRSANADAVFRKHHARHCDFRVLQKVGHWRS